MKDTATLAELAAGGDEEAFGSLVTLHYRDVYGVAFATVGRREVAEDIVQEAFLLAWKNLGRLRSAGAFTVWMRRIARNVAMSWLRSSLTREALAERYSHSIETEVSPAATQALKNADDRQALWEALQCLPPRLREAMVQFYLQEKNLAETARALGITANSVKVRLYQGRQLLRAHFEAELEREVSAGLKADAPGTARKRILAGLAVGPALPELIRGVPMGTLSLLSREFLTQGTGAIGTALKGGAIVKTASVVSIALVILLAAGYAWTGRQSLVPKAGEIPVAASRMEQIEVSAAGGELEPPPANVVPAQEPPQAQANPALAPPPQSTADAGASISGTVRDEAGAPIAGAEVLVMARLAIDADIASADPSYYRMDVRDITDAEGRYEVSGIPDWAACDPIAHAAGYRALMLDYLKLKAGERREGIDFTLAPGVTLRGRVVGRGGQSIAGSVVRAWGLIERDRVETGVQDLAVTDAEGWFSLGFKRAGLTYLHVTCDEGRALFEDIPVQDAEPVVVQMPAAATIHGRVTGPAGVPLNAAPVLLQRSLRIEGEGGSAMGGMIDVTVRTDAEGRYEMIGVQPGVEFSMCASPPASGPLETKLQPLVAGERRTQNFSTEPLATLTGTVTGAKTGKPLVEIGVLVERDGETVANVSTDTTGHFETTVSVPGEYLVCPTYPPSGVDAAFRSYGKTIQVEAGANLVLDLQFPDAVTMSVRAVDDKGEPVRDVSMQINWRHEGGGRLGMSMPSYPEGLVTWTAFPPDREAWFELSKAGYVPAQSSKRVGQSGENLPVEDVVLFRAANLTGRLLGPDGEVLKGVTHVTLSAEHPLCASNPAPTELGINGEFHWTSQVPTGAAAITIEAQVPDSDGGEADGTLKWHVDSLDWGAGDSLELGELRPSSEE